MKLTFGHDFYDHAHAGIDPTIQFIRDGRPKKPITEDDFPFHPQGRRNIRGGIGRRFETKFDLVYVIAAGKVYPAMLFENAIYNTHPLDHHRDYVRHPAHRSPIDTTNGLADTSWSGFRRNNNGHFDFIYDADEARQKLEEDLSREGEDWVLGSAGEVRAAVHDHFHTRNPDWDRWAIEHGVVTGFIAGDVPRPEAKWREGESFEESVHIEVNLDILGPAQFYKVEGKDAFTVFQEIAQFVGGVLASHGNDMVEIDDRYRVQAAGFDDRSFRKDPTKHLGRRRAK